MVNDRLKKLIDAQKDKLINEKNKIISDHENKKIAHSLLNKKATFDIVKVINEQTQKT